MHRLFWNTSLFFTKYDFVGEKRQAFDLNSFFEELWYSHWTIKRRTFKRRIRTRNPKITSPVQAQMKIHEFPDHVIPFLWKNSIKKIQANRIAFGCFWVLIGRLVLTAELIKSLIVRDLGEAQNQHAHRILRGRLSRKPYLLFRFSIILRYILKSEKSKHGLSLEFLEIKGVDRPMQGLS